MSYLDPSVGNIVRKIKTAQVNDKSGIESYDQKL